MIQVDESSDDPHVFTALARGEPFLLIPTRNDSSLEGPDFLEGPEPLRVIVETMTATRRAEFRVRCTTQRVPVGFRHGTYTLTFNEFHVCTDLPRSMLVNARISPVEQARWKVQSLPKLGS